MSEKAKMLLGGSRQPKVLVERDAIPTSRLPSAPISQVRIKPPLGLDLEAGMFERRRRAFLGAYFVDAKIVGAWSGLTAVTYARYSLDSHI
nr:hypothetical protein HmN_000176000 [Hymenolepis microstoma]